MTYASNFNYVEVAVLYGLLTAYILATIHCQSLDPRNFEMITNENFLDPSR